MSFDLDLTKGFTDIVGSKKKKEGKEKDFEFSRKNAANLNLGFEETVSDSRDPISVGHKRVVRKLDRRKTKTIRPLRKGGKFILGR